MRYLFCLGREPVLGMAEIEAVLSLWGIPVLGLHRHDKFLIVDIEGTLDGDLSMQRLGGTVKIALSIKKKEGVEWIEETIIDHLLATQTSGKICFSISPSQKKLFMTIKKKLSLGGRSARYIEPKNTATVLHNRLVEKQGDITIVGDDIFSTIAVQPIEEYGERDYGRPARDVERGMLPPKLAKILINLAGVPTSGTLLDPFCGSGTILMEAALMDYTNLIGSDISPKAIADTQKNTDWLRQKKDIKKTPALLVSDVRGLPKKIPTHTIDAIVTETYLGKPLHGNESSDMIRKELKLLETLYIDAFKIFDTLLKPGGRAVVVLPAFRSGDGWIHASCATSLKKRDSFFYARPDQWVGRDILIFEKS